MIYVFEELPPPAESETQGQAAPEATLAGAAADEG